jgi:hypothetical protein
MRLLHYSIGPLGTLRDQDQDSSPDTIKPSGLWLSVEGERDWKEWCEAESFRLNQWKVEQEVTLKDDALEPMFGGRKRGVLHLYSPACLDEFTRLYGKQLMPMSRHEWIDWPTVAADYDGLIISPYIHERRMSLLWYYGWDAASGCIWRPKRVVQSVGEPKPVTFGK